MPKNQKAHGGNMNLFTKSATRIISFSMLCLACTALTPVSAQAQNEAPADAKSDEVVMDEIIVTATRRDLKVSNIPLSIF
jgi:hypothetical protein